MSKQSGFTVDPLYSLKINPYPWSIHLFASKDELHQFSKELMPRHEWKEIGDDMDGLCRFSMNYKELLVGVFDRAKLDVLVHELSHAVTIMFEDVGIPINMDGSETFAYMMGFLYKTLKPHLRARKKKRSVRKVKKTKAKHRTRRVQRKAKRAS